MISIKEAAQQAAEFCRQLYPDAQDFLLEEVERDENDKFWLITISVLATVSKRSSSPLIAITGVESRFERHYKILKVDAQTGEVISMKIRELQS